MKYQNVAQVSIVCINVRAGKMQILNCIVYTIYKVNATSVMRLLILYTIWVHLLLVEHQDIPRGIIIIIYYTLAMRNKRKINAPARKDCRFVTRLLRYVHNIYKHRYVSKPPFFSTHSFRVTRKPFRFHPNQ